MRLYRLITQDSEKITILHTLALLVVWSRQINRETKRLQLQFQLQLLPFNLGKDAHFRIDANKSCHFELTVDIWWPVPVRTLSFSSPQNWCFRDFKSMHLVNTDSIARILSSLHKDNSSRGNSTHFLNNWELCIPKKMGTFTLHLVRMHSQIETFHIIE